MARLRDIFLKRILLIGKNGQVGWELERTLASLGELVAYDRTELDLARPDHIRAVLSDVQPNIIVNAAAWTAVDQAESEEPAATLINAIAPGILAEEAKRLDALLVHYSTDYVFDGSKASAYIEEDVPHPVNAYGRSKLAGEEAIHAMDCRYLIFRTSWVYGHRGHNFLKTILRLAAERDELRMVADQIGAPTWSRMIAEATALCLSRYENQEGIYHLSAAGKTSWHGFAQAIVANKKLPARMIPITTEEYPLPARRPANSQLDNTRLLTDFGMKLPSWDTQLKLALAG
ncbi:MAG: dTDP-4-dehydrorhamnose reductase [Rhodocyclaceae bacterium]|nr:dTDP-4-dehydrorhamnose reductase [Rhodocyclaceae bacterium]